MAVFPIICTLTIVLDSFNSNFLLREIYQIIFDLSFTLLCFLAPYLTYKMSEAWQNELHRIYVKIGLRKPNKIQSVRYSSRKLKGTFGEDINVEMN
ncbi:Serpentine Receptor, class E (Epsilon) [Caenorhabditis elegans]|nr:Serpentine Receptor, class E (Epsilon) [Caenorhabditis elegans]CDR32665.1 Serpentine Receptor, class E (Epsilon) [Caenorhabditis elegans]|eukprot:NP_001293900.1 Serpentine Receptor, class E (epsilon) [Caenorhabditis elegans]